MTKKNEENFEKNRRKEKGPCSKHSPFRIFWLDYQDSNLEKQNQNLLCYHYTIVQSLCAFC